MADHPKKLTDAQRKELFEMLLKSFEQMVSHIQSVAKLVAVLAQEER